MNQIDETTNLAKDNRVGIFMFFMKPINHKERKLKSYKEMRTYYGINVFKMREIVKLSDVVLANEQSKDNLSLGIISLRNDIIPLINLPKWLNIDLPDNYKDEYKLLICDFNNSKIGLLIAEPYRIEMKSWEEIGESTAYKTSETSKINNHTKTNETNDVCFILDIEQLLSEIMTSKEEKIDNDILNMQEDLSWVTKNGPIMIAEDSKVAQNHLKRIFSKVNINVEIYSNGQLLLNAMRNKQNIPLVITDLEMPIVSGHKVIQEIRKYDKKIPIIVNSSMTSDNNQREVLSLGATDFIGKTDAKRIIDLVKKYVVK